MSTVTAYCAPGRKPIAELLLAVRGEKVSEIVESPALTGSTDILLASVPEIEPGPMASVITQLPAHDYARLQLRRQFLDAIHIATPVSLCLTSTA
jgi:hypothetical protein